MNSAPSTKSPRETQDLPELLRRCASLCQAAERSLDKLPAEREAFLAQNLEGALLQLELILRVLGETRDTGRDAERQSLLRRLFARGGAAPDKSAKELALPSFDVSSQGLQGNSWTVSIAELIGFLAFANKTGLLWVDSPNENFLVGIVRGRLMHASSDHTPEGLRLGEVLVGLGFLTRRQLERFLTRDDDGGESVSGETLLESGMICDTELREALVYQVAKLFGRLIRTDQAVFRFQEGVNVQLAYQVDLDINQLLLDSARMRDEGVSPAQQAASVLKEWNSWRTELDDKIVDKIAETAAIRIEAQQTQTPQSAQSGKHKASGTPSAGTPEVPSDPQASAKSDGKSDAKSSPSKPEKASR